ncbi:ecdysone receptor isoform X1 [Planococcus citri]|uniref:ecdysone receptor isoform X1 n=1 Tax=Planococcus citri TaxID=170843 RepID=UPI0031F76047
MCAMDLKHHDVMYNNGGRPKGQSVIKSEPRSRSPCYNQGREIIRSPPTASSSSGLFNGIASSKRLRPPDDWLTVTPRSPVTVVSSVAVSASTSTNLSSSPGPALHSSIYPSTSNGYPSPTMSTSSYDLYNSGSKLSGEDLSPNSQNGYIMEVCDASKKKKGPTATARQQEELCLVCGDRASGYHYNALTCEGCKGFFRRSITKNAVYQCKYGNHCDIDMYMRRKCQECRLKKCLSVGMRPECVVPEYQCAVKRKEKKAQKDKDKPNSTTNGSPETIKIEPELQRVDSDPMMVNGVKPVSTEQEELIHSLVYFQEQYEQPSPDDLQRVFSSDETDPHAEGDMKYKHITEMTILTVQLIVEFAKSLPGFDKLLREDQITLLKACSSEVMMLRMARKYDSNTDSIVFANNQPYTKDSYNDAGMGETIEDLLRFCRQMWAMKVDNAEYALLTAIVIFSGRPALVEDWKVEKIQEVYIETLKSYVDNRVRPNSTTIFARLLSVLTELRTLGNRNFEMCLTLKLKSKVLPPFLSEIWDVAS